MGLWEDHDHTYCFIVSASEKSCSTPSDFPAVTWWSQEVSLFSDGGLLISWLPTVERPPRKKHLILHSLERVCVLACVQTAPLSESKGKLSVLCCIQKWRKFIHTQESCNVEALSWWALEKEVDNQINSTVWYEQTFAGETIRHIHIYTHTPINTHV